MKEQVKEWIVDKNLTTDSFDSVMIGVIYNSGHNTLDDPDVRKWIETHPNEFRLMLPPKLTDDQQVVLESLKHYYSKSNYYDIRAGKEPMKAVDRMLMEAESDTTGLSDVYYRLTEKQQFQVLAAFVEWGLSRLDN